METIVIEVDDSVAKVWRQASDEIKKDLSNKISVSLAEELMHNQKEEYGQFLQKLRSQMTAAGLSEDELAEILRNE